MFIGQLKNRSDIKQNITVLVNKMHLKCYLRYWIKRKLQCLNVITVILIKKNALIKTFPPNATVKLAFTTDVIVV